VPSEDSFIINFVLTEKMLELFEFTNIEIVRIYKSKFSLKYRLNCDKLLKKIKLF